MKKLLLLVSFVAVIMGSVNSSIAQNRLPVRNIVLVHGAFVDGSAWQNLYTLLIAKGFNVSVVQNPLSSLEDDVAATERVLDQQDGPVILVGHSWGGSVITQAGGHPKVVALVYVAAFAPKEGESTLDLIQTAPSAPENGILAPDKDGWIWYDKTKFHAGFAAEVSKSKSDFMWSSQGPVAVKCFVTPITKAAWRTKPSYAVVAMEDKSINPSIERMMYQRAGSKVTEIHGSHTLFITKAKEVAETIEQAATTSR